MIIATADGTAAPSSAVHPLGTSPAIVVSAPRSPDEPTHHLDACAIRGVVDFDGLLGAIEANPLAATALVLLQRDAVPRHLTAELIAESSTYSMLQAGPEFAAWNRAHPLDTERPAENDPVVVTRSDGRLEMLLNRPEERNALNAASFVALADALDVALADSDIASVRVSGSGPTFCSGGDLGEFGSFDDPVTSHLLRLRRHLGPRIRALGDRISFHVHGACRGSGVELPAFANQVVAHRATTFALPEVAMGLIPGAGGTVSITERIGRLRATTLALSGAVIDAECALAWGLIDAIVED